MHSSISMLYPQKYAHGYFMHACGHAALECSLAEDSSESIEGYHEHKSGN